MKVKKLVEGRGGGAFADRLDRREGKSLEMERKWQKEEGRVQVLLT